MKNIMRFFAVVLLLMVVAVAGCDSLTGDTPGEPEPEPEPTHRDVEVGNFEPWPASMLFAPNPGLPVEVSVTSVRSFIGAPKEVFWAVGEATGAKKSEADAKVSRRVAEGESATLRFLPEDVGQVVKLCVTEVDDRTTCFDAPNWRIEDKVVVALKSRGKGDYDLILRHLPSSWTRTIGRCTVPLFNGETTALGPFPDVSPDGTKVLCVDQNGDFVEYPIYGENYGEGKKVVLRAENAGGDYPSNPAYSPDGTKIAYTAYRPVSREPVGGGPTVFVGDRPQLFTKPMNGGAPRRISESDCEVERLSNEPADWVYVDVNNQRCINGVRSPLVWAEEYTLFSLANDMGWVGEDEVPVFRVDLSAPQFSYSEFVTETGIQNGSLARVEPMSYNSESQTLFATIVGDPTHSVAYKDDGANKIELGDSFYWPDGSVSGRILAMNESSVFILDQNGAELEHFARGGTSNLERAQNVPGWTFLP